MNFLHLLAAVVSGYIIGEGLPLYYWKHAEFENFGDQLSLEIVQRMVGNSIQECPKKYTPKLVAVGSVISAAQTGDVVWGTGAKGYEAFKCNFTQLDVRAVRGPRTGEFLRYNFGISAPPIYGDPVLLFPYLFPEFKKNRKPKNKYVIIPHYSEQWLFPKDQFPEAVYPTERWDKVIEKILDSEMVISGSLHGIIVAEAYGIPARLLRRVTKDEPLFKYQDYYEGTGRPDFQIAFSVHEALEMGGEPPIRCDLEKLYRAFPWELWPQARAKKINFKRLP